MVAGDSADALARAEATVHWLRSPPSRREAHPWGICCRKRHSPGRGTKETRGAVVRIIRTAAPLMAAKPDQSSVSVGPSAREEPSVVDCVWAAEPLRRAAFALCLPRIPWLAVSR